MLGPVRLAIEDGKTGLHFDIFSTDPRITKKFNEALATLLAGAKKKVNTVTDYLPSPRAMAYLAHETTAIEPVASMESVATGMAESAGVFFEKLRQQIDGLVQPKLDEDGKSSADASAFAQSLPAAGSAFEPGVIAPHALYESMSAGIKSFTERSVESAKQQIDMLKNKKETASADAILSDYPPASIKLASDDTLTSPKRISTSKKQLSVIASRTRKRQAKSPQAPRKAEIASPASRVNKPAIGAPSAVREIKLQTGITENNWLPNQDTVLMLTRSTAEYVQADQMSLRQEIASVLNSEGFSVFEETSTIFRPHDARPGNHLNRYFAPVKEVTLDDSSLPFLARALDIAKPDEIIARTYKDVCEKATVFGIDKLVLTPCFSMPAATQSGNFKAYTRAIAVMVTTLDQLSITSPKLDLTLAARSGAEQVLIQGCMTALKEQKARDALRSL